VITGVSFRPGGVQRARQGPFRLLRQALFVAAHDMTTALEWTAARGEADVRAETLQAAAQVLTLGRDAIQLIDGEPNEEEKPGKEEPGDTDAASA